MQKTKHFAVQLKSTLQAGVKQGGVVEGIQVCKTSAQAIAQAHSIDGWTVGRTSLKLRNQNNKPDGWESEQLAFFDTQMRSGVDPKTLAVSAKVVNEEGIPEYRFMKAIPTGKLCLNCHGSKIAPNVKSVINQHYPEDKAVGFNLGDLRGAFTLTKSIDTK